MDETIAAKCTQCGEVGRVEIDEEGVHSYFEYDNPPISRCKLGLLPPDECPNWQEAVRVSRGQQYPQTRQ